MRVGHDRPWALLKGVGMQPDPRSIWELGIRLELEIWREQFEVERRSALK